MDRRQKRTKEAIFTAFAELLSRKNYNQISVQEIIDGANVGRTTFYAHFETKEYLLKALCEELFDHITDTAMGASAGDCKHLSHMGTDSVFLHLLKHLQENDYNILGLLSSDNNQLFLGYFKSNLKRLVVSRYDFKNAALPEDYLVNHVASSFAETVSWWLSRRMKDTPEAVTAYFLATTEPFLREK